MSTAIAIEHLTKEYLNFWGTQKVLAVNDLNLEVEEGHLYGFLGPNGAGKTTTIKILLGILYPTAGTCRVSGQVISSTQLLAPEVISPQLKRTIGYLPEGPYFHEFMTGEEVLKFYGRLYGMRGAHLDTRISETLDQVGMTFARKRIVKNYSKGMRQRLGLAQALLSNPSILVLDEPTTGLDPIARREIRDALIGLGQEGKTLFICSHELAEVEVMCDRVAIIDKGRLVHEGRMVDLLYGEESAEVHTKDLSPETRAAFERDGARVIEERGGIVKLALRDGKDVYEAVLTLRSAGAPLLGVHSKRRTLEDLFIASVEERQGS